LIVALSLSSIFIAGVLSPPLFSSASDRFEWLKGLLPSLSLLLFAPLQYCGGGGLFLMCGPPSSARGARRRRRCSSRPFPPPVGSSRLFIWFVLVRGWRLWRPSTDIYVSARLSIAAPFGCVADGYPYRSRDCARKLVVIRCRDFFTVLALPRSTIGGARVSSRVGP